MERIREMASEMARNPIQTTETWDTVIVGQR